MAEKARYFELRTREGKSIFSFYLYEKEVDVNEEVDVSTNSKQEGHNNEQKNNQRGNDNMMTDAQKRFLFRILADKGIEGDKAHEHLKNLFHVNALKEVTKFEASKMIERLLEEAKGGNSDGIPF